MRQTKTVNTSPVWSLTGGNVLCTGGSTFTFSLLQDKSFPDGDVSLMVFFLASTFCVLSRSSWLELGPPLASPLTLPLTSPSQIISNISALLAVDRGRTTLTRGRSPRLPPVETHVIVRIDNIKFGSITVERVVAKVSLRIHI